MRSQGLRLAELDQTAATLLVYRWIGGIGGCGVPFMALARKFDRLERKLAFSRRGRFVCWPARLRSEAQASPCEPG